MSSDWKQSSLDRRDFRHIHGDPEVPPHRKKAKKVNRARCNHEYSEWESRELNIWWTEKTEEFPDRTETRRRTYTHSSRYCLHCRRREYKYGTTETLTIRDNKGHIVKVDVRSVR